MRSSLLAIALAAERAGLRRRQAPPATFRPRTRRRQTPKPDKDVVKASVEEDAQPVRRSIPLRGHDLAYTVDAGPPDDPQRQGRADGEHVLRRLHDPVGAAAAAGHLPVQRRPRLLDHVAAHGLVRPDEGRRLDARDDPRTAVPLRRRTPTRLLDVTDLVFIDAPTTGLSRELGKAEPKDFFGVDKDLDAFTRTIQRYLTKYQRWNSPKFIIGESYGTTRAAGLSNSLLDAGVQLNGIAFVSTVFNFADFQGDQSLINFLPTYAADAWYHGKIADKPPLDGFIQRGARLCQRPLCLGAAEGRMRSATRRSSRSRSRWRS